jgi:hypothetical protein
MNFCEGGSNMLAAEFVSVDFYVWRANVLGWPLCVNDRSVQNEK